jgi:ribonuclease BN (tRNA processing enzyme)
VGLYAAGANVRRLLLTHLWPDTDAAAGRMAAGEAYHGEIGVATSDLTLDLP